MVRGALTAGAALLALALAPTAAADLTLGVCVLGLGVPVTAAGVPGPFLGVVVGLGDPGVYTNYGGFVSACNAGEEDARVCALGALCAAAHVRALP